MQRPSQLWWPPQQRDHSLETLSSAIGSPTATRPWLCKTFGQFSDSKWNHRFAKQSAANPHRQLEWPSDLKAAVVDSPSSRTK